MKSIKFYWQHSLEGECRGYRCASKEGSYEYIVRRVYRNSGSSTDALPLATVG